MTADNSLFAIFVQVHRLILHVDLLLQLQVALTKDQDFSFKGHVDIGWGANRTEDLDCLAFAVNRGDQTKVVWRKEVYLIGVLPNELILVALQFVAPGQDKFWANILDEGWLEVVKLHRAVGAVVDA